MVPGAWRSRNQQHQNLQFEPEPGVITRNQAFLVKMFESPYLYGGNGNCDREEPLCKAHHLIRRLQRGDKDQTPRMAAVALTEE